jgi:predicted MPP superfamily phosphohydrolase
MLAVDAAAVMYLWGRKTPQAWSTAVIAAGGAAVLLAVGFGRLGKDLEMVLLAAYGLFIHGVIGMSAAAWILWPTRRRLAVLAGVIALVLVIVGVDGFFIEPHWLEVTHLRIASDKVDRPTRIVVLADLQADRFGPYEQQVLREVLWQQPDLILLAGDYCGEPGSQEHFWQQVNAFMHVIRFSAPRGVFAVRGNCDTRGWEAIVKDLPATAVSKTQTSDLGGLWLTCLSLRDSRNPELEISRPTSAEFHIVLGHVPNFAMGQVNADLLLAGHTHGGQVRLPWIGPLVTLSKLPRSWAAGVTELPGGRKLVVSRGIGMQRDHAPQVRFLCRPQLVVIDLLPQGPEEKGR